MKTREEVESLKANWRNDPCWNLSDTVGFEEYREELAKYEKTARAEWEAKRILEVYAKHRKWYELKLNESFWPTSDTWVLRVPNGWFVTNYQGNESETAMSQSSAFIPYSELEA